MFLFSYPVPVIKLHRKQESSAIYKIDTNIVSSRLQDDMVWVKTVPDDCEEIILYETNL